MRELIRKALKTHGRLTVDPTDIDTDADLYDLGLTSHATVNVMLALEDEFDVEFPDVTMRKSTFASIDSIEQVVLALTS